MAKPSAFLSRIQAEQKESRRRLIWFTVRQCLDMACIAMNEEFGFGEDRLKRFADAYSRVWSEYAGLTVEDARDDKTIEYSAAKFEERLKEICGRYYTPRDVRYE